MGRYTGKKNRIARRFGVNIFGRARNPLLHKPNPPGVHVARRRKKSDYGLQLHEKQKLKAIYGMISEKQLVGYYSKALHRTGNTAEHLVQQLECRLDNVVYRLKLASTIFGAHQLVAHGHVLVDGKKVDIRSFQVRPGMEIAIREKSRKMKCILAAGESSGEEVPPFLEWNKDNLSGKMLALPVMEDIPLPIEVNVPEICDFLAHTT